MGSDVMAEFVHSKDLDGSSKKIKEVLEGSDVCIASAFLGIGADEYVPEAAKVICDITMGGTNPEVLKTLRAKLKGNLRHIPHFHAKVYISDKGCVIGSANLSSNGVGFLAPSKLVEAAVKVGPETQVAEDARDWFDKIWSKHAKAITDEDIDWARTRWNANKTGMPQGRGNPATFEAAVRDPSSNAAQWSFILTRHELSDGVEENADEIAPEVRVQSMANDDSTLEYYEDLGNAKQLDGYYIGIHKQPDGNVDLLALRFLGNRDVKVDQKSYLVSFFSVIDWDSIGIPMPSKADLIPGGRISRIIETAEADDVGHPISAERFAEIL